MLCWHWTLSIIQTSSIGHARGQRTQSCNVSFLFLLRLFSLFSACWLCRCAVSFPTHYFPTNLGRWPLVVIKGLFLFFFPSPPLSIFLLFLCRVAQRKNKAFYSSMTWKITGGGLCFHGAAMLLAARARLQVRYLEFKLSLGILHRTSKNDLQAKSVSLMLAFATVLFLKFLKE